MGQFIIWMESGEVKRNIKSQILFNPSTHFINHFWILVQSWDDQINNLQPYISTFNRLQRFKDRLQACRTNLVIKFFAKTFKIDFHRIEDRQKFQKWFPVDITIRDNRCLHTILFGSRRDVIKILVIDCWFGVSEGNGI